LQINCWTDPYGDVEPTANHGLSGIAPATSDQQSLKAIDRNQTSTALESVAQFFRNQGNGYGARSIPKMEWSSDGASRATNDQICGLLKI